MRNNKFRQQESIRTTMPCSCGKSAKLIKRRNFPHGRKSTGRTTMAYRCDSCNTEHALTK